MNSMAFNEFYVHAQCELFLLALPLNDERDEHRHTQTKNLMNFMRARSGCDPCLALQFNDERDNHQHAQTEI